MKRDITRREMFAVDVFAKVYGKSNQGPHFRSC